MSGIQRLKVILLSMLSALAKSIPIIGPAVEQISVGTRSMLVQQEMLALLRDISDTFESGLREHSEAVRRGEGRPEEVVIRLIEERPDQVAHLSQRLESLTIDVLMMLIDYLNKTVPPDAPSTDHTRMLSDAFGLYQAHLRKFGDRSLRRAPYMPKAFTRLRRRAVRAAETLASAELVDQGLMRRLIEAILSDEDIETVRFHALWASEHTNMLHARLARLPDGARLRFSLDFSEIFTYAHSHELLETGTPFVVYMIDNSPCPFVVLPGSLSELLAHIEMAAESLLGPRRFATENILRNVRLVAPEIMGLRSSVFSRFAHFIQYRMLRLEDICGLVEPDSRTVEYLTHMFERRRRLVGRNNYNDALDLGILVELNRRQGRSNTWWIHVTSTSTVYGVLKDLRLDPDWISPENTVVQQPLTVLAVKPEEYVLHSEARGFCASESALMDILKRAQSLGAELNRGLLAIQEAKEGLVTVPQQSPEAIARAAKVFLGAADGIKRFQREVGDVWLNKVLQKVNAKWSDEFAPLYAPIRSTLDYEQFNLACDRVLSDIFEVVRVLRPVAEAYRPYYKRREESTGNENPIQ